jgi:filamentous hemagglutinin family protein
MLARAFFLSVSTLPFILYGLPQGAEVKAGHAECSGDAMSVEIRASDKSIIEYQSFNIQEGEKVTFIQPNRSATVLNRVIGNDPSSIWGQLEANGKVFLVNRNGIYFSPSARVNVGSLIASTLDISDQNFLEERYLFQQNSNEDASIVNAGLLSASPEGFIALLGSRIQNDGVIAAKAGKVVCAAGEKITLDFAGDELISFTVQGKVKGSISQNGTIDVQEGDVFLRMGDAHHVLQEIVNTDGAKEAHYILEEDGHIFLSASSKIAGEKIEIHGKMVEAQGEVVSTGDLKMTGTECLRFRDSNESPLTVVAYRDLILQSNLIDIFALKHEKTALASGRATTLISDNPISADGHFYSGGDFSLMKTSGVPADFVSLWDPVISATGSVSFGAYTGVSLLVQSTGRITPTGNIVITAPESGATITAGTERATLIGGASLILRAGLGALDASYTGAGVFPVPPNTTQGGATFTNTATLTGTDLTFTGTTITLNSTPGPVGSIILAAAGGIVFGANTTINADGGSVTFSNTVNGDIAGRTLTINSGAGAILFSPGASIGNLQPLGAIALTTTSGNITLDTTVLGGNSTIATGTGAISFTGALNSDSTARTLTISTGASPSISFTSVGNSNPLIALNIDADGTPVSFSGAFTMGASCSFTTAGGGVTFFGAVNGNGAAQTLTINSAAGNILFSSTVGSSQSIGLALTSSSGNITVTGACTLGANSTISATTGAISFGSTLNSDGTVRTLTINKGSTNSVGFTGAVGSTNPLGALTITTAAAPITFSDVLTLGASSTFSTAGGIVTFTGAVNGNAAAQTLTVTSAGGNILFSSTVGGTQPIGLALTTSTGNITVSGACALGANSTLSATTGAISFGSTLNGDNTARTLTINKGSNNTNKVSFTGAVGNLDPLSTLTISTDGVDITFSSTLTLGANSTITSSGGAVTFTGAVNGNGIAQVLTADSGAGALLFSNTIGNVQPLGLALSSTAGNITCTGNVILGGNSTLSSGTGGIAFNGTLDSDTTLRTLTINKGTTNSVAFVGAVGAVAPLGALTINTNNAPVTFSSSLMIGASSTITTQGGAVTVTGIANASTSGLTLTVSSLGGLTHFIGTVGNTQPFALALQSSAGGCTFDAALVLGGNSTINSISGAVNIDLINSDSTPRTLAINSGTGNINFNKGLAATAGGLQNSPLGTVTITTTSGNVTFGTVAGTGNAFFGATGGGINTITTTGGNVLFNGTANGDSLLSRPLTITSNGSITFTGAVGNTDPFGAMILNAGTTLTFSSAFLMDGAVTINATAGPVNFAAINNIHEATPLTVITGSAGAVNFNGLIGAVNAIGDIAVTTAGGAVTFAQNVNLGGNMTLITAGGNILFSGDLNGDIIGRTFTSFAAAGSTIFQNIGNSVRLAAMSVNNVGPAAMTVNGTLTMGGDASFTTRSSPITFNGAVNADHPGRTLNVYARFGSVTFNAPVGNLKPFALNLNASSGSIIFGVAAPLVINGASSMLTNAGPITINSTIDADNAPEALTMRSDTGNVVMLGTVGGNQGFSSLTVAGENITIPNVGGSLPGVVNALTLAAHNAINFTGTTYNSGTHSYSGLVFNYTAGTSTTLTSAAVPITLPTTTLSIQFAPTTIQLSSGSHLQIVTNGGNVTVPTILGSSPENVTILGGTGNVTLGVIGGGIGSVYVEAGSVTLSDTINCQTIDIESTGNILNDFGPHTITTSGNAIFNSYTGTDGIRSSPINVNSGGQVFAGSPTLGVFSGTTSDNTIHPLPSNPPCILIFNGVLLADCTDPHFVPPGTNVPGARPSNMDVMFVQGIYNFFFNLGSDFYFLPDWIDEKTLEHGYMPLYYIPMK